jgi:two-component system sensor histidine kinase DesK
MTGADRWWMVAAIWLVFLVYPIVATAEASAPTWAKVLTFACIGGFGVTYCLGFGGRLSGAATVTALVVFALACVPVVRDDVITFVPFLCVACAMLLPAPWWPWLTAAAALSPFVWLPFEHDVSLPYFLLLVWPITLGMVVLRLVDASQQQRDAERAEYALVAERERVARDVHDVLGHSLTVLSVKAELAARLVDVDPERARAELESIQQTARQALSEVRLTVSGLRAGNLADEVAAVPAVLRDAGVDTVVAGSVDETDPRHRTLLAWVLREAATNVVRHSRAAHVEIRLDASGLTVRDDGVGWGGVEGNGVRGMRERVEAAGGTLRLSDSGPGTCVEVVFA